MVALIASREEVDWIDGSGRKAIFGVGYSSPT